MARSPRWAGCTTAPGRAALAEAGAVFDTFNIDLMYALPGQTLAALDADLRAALEHAPPHLSIYQLTIGRTRCSRITRPRCPTRTWPSTCSISSPSAAAPRAWQRYEETRPTRPGHRCRHNVNYWEFGDYLGIGAGAHGKISFPQRVLRQIRWRDPARYVAQALAGQAVAQEDEVAGSALPFEFMLNALRLKDGFELARFTERTGLPLTAIAAAARAGRAAHGLLARDLTRAWPTARGFDLLSDLQALFLLTDPAATGAGRADN